ncbi:MAG: hypothetical protein JXX29_09870 [Deltaproteobacteria bacterium]|nr:hypothetical protein [Deltaproteobacteria bacterium]MBN2671972.1 hypothetical protein [Deltaproteobacteria bacterium]
MSQFHQMGMQCLLATIVIMIVSLSPTHAQSDNTELAREQFTSGLQLFDEEEYDAAAAAFRRANELSFNWKLLYNIGQSEAAAGRYGLALESFESYLAHGADQIIPERREEILKEIRRLRDLTGSLEVVAPEGAVVHIDGQERGISPLPGDILIAAGIDHEIVVVLNSEELFRRNIRLSGKQRRTLQISAEAEVVETTEDVSEEGTHPENAASSKKRGLKIAGITLLGVGGGALIGGGITGGLALKAGNTLEKNCNEDGICDSSQEDTRNTGKTMATLSTILFVSGGALAATGIILLAVHKKKQNEKLSRVQLVPDFSPQYSGVMLQGRF